MCNFEMDTPGPLQVRSSILSQNNNLMQPQHLFQREGRLSQLKADDSLHHLHRDLRANSVGDSSVYGGMSLPEVVDSKIDTNNYLRE